MGNPFAWIEIPVDDMPRARRFYEDVFETTLQCMPGTEFEMWSFDFDETSTVRAGPHTYAGVRGGKTRCDRVFRMRRLFGPSGARRGGRRPRPPAENVDRAIRLHCAYRRHRGDTIGLHHQAEVESRTPEESTASASNSEKL
jgi:hypothetical protein